MDLENPPLGRGIMRNDETWTHQGSRGSHGFLRFVEAGGNYNYMFEGRGLRGWKTANLKLREFHSISYVRNPMHTSLYVCFSLRLRNGGTWRFHTDVYRLFPLRENGGGAEQED